MYVTTEMDPINGLAEIKERYTALPKNKDKLKEVLRELVNYVGATKQMFCMTDVFKTLILIYGDLVESDPIRYRREISRMMRRDPNIVFVCRGKGRTRYHRLNGGENA